MELMTIDEFVDTLTGTEERTIRVRFGAPIDALTGHRLLRAAQFRQASTGRP